MKNKKSLLLLIVLAALVAGSTSTAHAAEGISPAAYLTEEGFLNTPADFSGTFELSDWQVTLDNEKGVQIQPATAAIGGIWSALGGGLNNDVKALVVDNGIIYAGGWFLNAGGDPNADHIAKFENSVWSSLGGSGTGLNYTVFTLLMNNGVLYAGGQFTNAGGDSNADRIAKFDNGSWSSLGGANTGLNSTVFTLMMNGGVIYAGGSFTNAGGDANADLIAKYTGGAWSSLGGANTGLDEFGIVSALLIDSGVIYAGGSFTDAGGDTDADYIAKYESGAWSSLGGTGTGLSYYVNTLLMDGGVLYAGGHFQNAGGDADADYIAKFESGTWSSLGGAGTGLPDTVNVLLMHDGILYAGGSFYNAGEDPNADRIAKYESGAWSALHGPNPGLTSTVADLLIKGRTLYAGGNFENAGGIYPNTAIQSDVDNIAQFGLVPAEPFIYETTKGAFSTHIEVKWREVDNITRYEVYRLVGTKWIKRTITTGLFYKDTATTPLVTYKYKVRACNAYGCGKMSSFNNYASGYRGKLITTQLVRNLGFEIDTNNDGIPNFWTRASNNGLDKRICSPAAKHLGKCGYRFLGDNVARKDWIRQNLSAKALAKGGGHNGDKLILSFYARSLRLELADGAYVLVKVRNSATHKQQVIRVNLTGTHAYKRFTKTLKVTIGDYDQVWVYVYANGTANENLYVDNLSVRLQYIQTK